MVQAFKAKSQKFVAAFHYPVGKLIHSEDKLLLEVRGNKATMSYHLHDDILFIYGSNFFLGRMVYFFDGMSVEHYRSA